MTTLHLTLKMTTAQVVTNSQSPTTVFLKTTLLDDHDKQITNSIVLFCMNILLGFDLVL